MEKQGSPLLEAHIQFEENRFKEDLQQTIREEVAGLFKLLQKITVNQVLTAAQVCAWVKRNIQEFPITPETVTFIKERVAVIHTFLRQEQSALKSILAKKHYDGLVANIIKMDEMKNSLIHKSVYSSIYSMLIADVLYHGIKDFILTENIIAKNVPGISSLIKMGQGMLRQTVPSLEDSIDKTLIEFVNSNIQSTMRQSESFLVKALDERRLKQLSQDIWDAIEHKKLAAGTDFIKAEHIDSFSPVIQDWWSHFRKTSFFSNLCEQVITDYFQQYGDQKISKILAEMGISKKILTTEALEFFVPLVEKPEIRQYLQKKIRSRLESFYTSDQATAILKNLNA
ncbi:hypothetical protein ACFL27_13035 [candidate division CSSED10-310 bacterium]|uniref:Uncharacterized protein n=1 Tax=candidate division CSSED10-310 bacterium TaxID=2855610 RepID=A0ABV6YY56_UNCC1